MKTEALGWEPRLPQTRRMRDWGQNFGKCIDDAEKDENYLTPIHPCCHFSAQFQPATWGFNLTFLTSMSRPIRPIPPSGLRSDLTVGWGGKDIFLGSVATCKMSLPLYISLSPMLLWATLRNSLAYQRKKKKRKEGRKGGRKEGTEGLDYKTG